MDTHIDEIKDNGRMTGTTREVQQEKKNMRMDEKEVWSEGYL